MKKKIEKKNAHILKKGTHSPINISVLKLNSRFGDNRYKIIFKKLRVVSQIFKNFTLSFLHFFQFSDVKCMYIVIICQSPFGILLTHLLSIMCVKMRHVA